MNKTIKTFILLAMMLGMYGYGNAQESVNAAGGDAMGTGGTASYSVGQVVYTTIGENGTTVAQGVQQAYQQPEAIPTMSEWGLLILMLLLIIVAVQGLKAKAGRNVLNSTNYNTPNYGCENK